MLNTMDVAIIGAGPAGLACAIQAVRQGLTLALFEKGQPGGQALAAHCIENYPGFAEGISGRELMEQFIRQAQAHSVPIRHEAALNVKTSSEGFHTLTSTGETVSKTLVVASGLRPKRIGIPGESELEGKRIFFYADPERVPHEGRHVLVMGGGDAAFDQAINFSRKAARVDIAMRSDLPRCAPPLLEEAVRLGIEVLPGRNAVSLCERDETLHVGFAGIGIYACDLLVACIGKEQHFEFLDRHLRNGDHPGLFLAGDCCHERDRHIAIAVGDGVLCAMRVAKHLKRL